MVGAPRFTQLRTRARQCERGPLPRLNFGDRPPLCYGDGGGDFTTDPEVEDTRPFGGTAALPPFTFSVDPGEPFWLLNETYGDGTLVPPRGSLFSGFAGARTNWGRVYPAAGFSVALPNSDGDVARGVIRNLKQAGCVDLVVVPAATRPD